MKRATLSSTLFLLIVSITSLASAQDLPKLIYPSPDVSALFKYQDWPVDFSTGLPQISIPLYQVKSGSLTVPISINYHASGRKISDQDGAVALGWALNAGGTIGRIVHGDPDFGVGAQGVVPFPSYPIKTTGIDNLSTMAYLENLAHSNNNPDSSNPGTWLDGEYDVFSYDLCGRSGKFIFKDSNGIKKAVTIPYKPYVITPHYSVYSGMMQGLTGIDILDDKGVTYIFSITEKLNTNNIVSGLLLTQIISADKVDTIAFQYQGFSQWSITYNQKRVQRDVFYYPTAGLVDPNAGENYNDYDATTQYSYTIYRLKEIDFRQGKVKFNMSGTTDKIDNMQIIDNSSSVLKTVQFNRAFMDQFAEGGVGSNPIVTQSNNKLASLDFKDKTGATVETYSFQYYPTAGTIDPHYCDWWGYYNNSGKMNMIPRYRIKYEDGRGGLSLDYPIGGYDFDREPNLAALKSGVLQKITYPTGGTTEFIYENNQYMSPTWAQMKAGPGLRIAQINTDDNQGTKMSKVYKYGTGENGYGSLDLEPQPKDMVHTSEPLGMPDYMSSELWNGYYTTITSSSMSDESIRVRTFYSDFLPEVSEIAHRPVVYSTVTEYEGTPSNNIGKTVYTYDNIPWYAFSFQAIDTRRTMTKYQVTTCSYWDPASLLTKTDYLNTGNGQYSVRKSTVNTYDRVQIDDAMGVHVARFWDFPNSDAPVQYAPSPIFPEAYGIKYDHYQAFMFGPYHISIGSKNLSSSVQTINNDDGTQTTSTSNYSYNAKQYINKTIISTSDNNTINSSTNYPFDYAGIAALDQMSSSSVNMLDFPIEKIQTKVVGTTSNLLSSVRTNYYNYGTTPPRIYPQTVDVSKGSGSYETRLHYYGYDASGNPLSVSKEKDAKISYIWDYNSTYPIAEVKNATSSDIAYTSFEADGTGNWGGINTANIIASAKTVTGSRYYSLSGIPLTKSVSTGNYIVSYWSKNGSYNVNSSTAKTLRTVVTADGVTWTNYEHNISNTSSISVNGTGAIDELRLYPDNAQMTSYTFTPLVGMTTQADANGRISYYEYDNYGRVKLIRDMDRNIIKTFSYTLKSTTY